jgi:predicted nucleic acid-binding Zn ribbon protein
VQSVWSDVVGERIAAAATPVSEQAGEITVACIDAVWAEELDLMQERLKQGLCERLGDSAPQNLRFRVEDG